MDHVAILLASFNGARFIDEQLASFEAQVHRNWSLWVSDDGSQDDTLARLAAFALRNPHRRITIFDGPRRGPTANFLSLISRPEIVADIFAFSDQDDVWLPERLSSGVASLAASGDRPALIGTRSVIVDESLREKRLSPLFSTSHGFAHALAQNIAGGNTMTFNVAARSLAARFAPDIDVWAHDWWLYQLITGAGGQVTYDPRPSIMYRQHSQNVFGPYRGFQSYMARLMAAWAGEYKENIDRQIEALVAAKSVLLPENVKILEHFIALRQQSGLTALKIWLEGPIRRQTNLGNALLAIGLATGRI